MARFAFIALLAPVLVSSLVGAAPLRSKRSPLARRAFTESDYATFQISGGVAGNAEAEANAVFVDPFKGVDLATISAADLKSLSTMRSAAEDAETNDFNPAIAKASGAAADALQVGKIKNKVLKLTGLVQIDAIKIAQAKAAGEDTADLEASQAAEQKKLTTNIATDVASAGQPSTPVAGSSAGSAASSSDTTVVSSAKASKAIATKTSKSSATAKVSSSAAVAKASSTPSTSTISTSTGSFVASDYSSFQISGGVAGNAQAEANAVFVDPFKGVDLATVSAADLDALATMRSAAESAETDSFNPAIAKASGAAADALQVGKIKNKVLKLTGLVQIDAIKIAQAKAAGKDTADLEASQAGEQKKLTTNIATDVASAGQASSPAP